MYKLCELDESIKTRKDVIMGYDGNVTIGGVRFSGVKVERSEVKNINGSQIYCVWTDAGYMEYKKNTGANGQNACVQAVDFPDLGTKSLSLINLSDGRLDLDSSNYQGGVVAMGRKEGSETFTINAKNGQYDDIMIYNKTQTIGDWEDRIENR